MFFRKKEPISFPKSIFINEKKYGIEITFYPKNSSSVNIKGNILSFRLSSKLSHKEKVIHFQSLLSKISKKVSTISLENTTSFREIFHQKKFEFAGNAFTIVMHPKRITKIVDSICYVDASLDIELIEKKLEKLLIKHFSSNLINYVHFINSQSYNFPITDVIIKNVSSKWGHCTHDNTILMNIKLLNAPKEILDYVIYHELSHVIHKNHSARFWQEVSKFCPNYKELRRLLKQNPPSLFKLIKD